MGRPRKPNDVKILEGTWRKDRHGEQDKALLADSPPKMPQGMSKDAKTCWKQLIKRLFDTGRMSSEDIMSFQIFCESWAEHKKLQTQIAKMDLEDKGYAAAHRLVTASIQTFRLGAAKFGLTPSDRAGMRVQTKQAEGVKARVRA